MLFCHIFLQWRRSSGSIACGAPNDTGEWPPIFEGLSGSPSGWREWVFLPGRLPAVNGDPGRGPDHDRDFEFLRNLKAELHHLLCFLGTGGSRTGILAIMAIIRLSCSVWELWDLDHRRR